MKKILFSSLLAVGLIAMTACTSTNNSGMNASVNKCATKCGSSDKCKGSKKMKKSVKCAAGKCGSK